MAAPTDNIKENVYFFLLRKIYYFGLINMLWFFLMAYFCDWFAVAKKFIKNFLSQINFNSFLNNIYLWIDDKQTVWWSLATNFIWLQASQSKTNLDYVRICNHKSSIFPPTIVERIYLSLFVIVLSFAMHITINFNGKKW
jgi:hypothetical protein